MGVCVIPELGEKENTAVIDPAANAKIIPLLKGLLTQIQGSGSGSVPATLATTLDKEYDSIDAAKRSKGSVTVALSSATATTQSSEIDCRGFSAASVECAVSASTAGSWVVSIQGSALSGGTFGNCFKPKDDGTFVAMATPSMSSNENYTYLFNGIPNFIKVTGTRSTDGTLTCRVTPMNL